MDRMTYQKTSTMEVNNMEPDGSSLILVHIVFNIVNQST